MKRFELPAEVSALHDFFVRPLFRTLEFRAIEDPTTPTDLRTRFYVRADVISATRRMLAIVQERVALKEFCVTWKGCRRIHVDDPHELGVYRLHSISADDETPNLLHLRAEPDLAISFICDAAEVVDEGESDEYETRRTRVGTWEVSSWDMLLPRVERKAD